VSWPAKWRGRKWRVQGCSFDEFDLWAFYDGIRKGVLALPVGVIRGGRTWDRMVQLLRKEGLIEYRGTGGGVGGWFACEEDHRGALRGEG
jgi:hypothetical protein